MNHTPFTTIGDEPIEARIVAWVLGEASAFEVAELERLCEERPELLIFRRRMMALHQLLKDAADSRGSEAWKLVPDKRRALDDVLGQKTPVTSAPMLEKRVRHSGRRALLAIAACVILTVVIGGLMAPMVMQQSKKSSGERLAYDARVADLENMDETVMAERGMMMDSEGEKDGKVRLQSAMPDELIEGTPKPITLSGTATEVASMAKKEVTVGSRPAAPTTSTARAVAASAAAPASTPVPTAQQPASMVESSEGHGAGWSDGGGSGGGGALASAAEGFGDTGLDSFAAAEGAQTPAPGQIDSSGRDYDAAPASRSDALASTNPAKTAEGGQNLDDVRSPLYAAEDNSRLGRVDDGKKSKSDAGLAANGRTRAELLAKADPAWEFAERTDKDLRRETARQADSLLAAKDSNGPYGKKGGVENELHAGYSAEYLSRGEASGKGAPVLPEDAEALAKAIQQQEGKVEERRKVLATIGRTKGILYKGDEKPKEEAIKRGLDAQDYVDAKKEFEEDQKLLQQMKLKLQSAKQTPPQVSLPQLMEEIIASEDPYSTFSLNISDASFQVAQAALAKGERPDPAGIKVEQFYNAVDYGDPAPSAGQPVAATIEQAAHPVIPGRNLVRIALKTAAAGRSAAQPLRLTLLVDQSGSMSREDRRAAMDKALAGLGGLLTEKDLVNIIGFSRTARLLADGMPGNQAGKFSGLINQAANEGGTNLEQAMVLAGELAVRRQLAGAQNRIVLFTDGAANLGDADPARLADKVRQLRQKGIAFDIAGIAADGLNDELLAELARNGDGRYYVIGKGGDDNLAAQLAGAFRPAAENVKVQVRFNPERVARYKLIGFEKDRLKTEDFRNDTVDAAELAAEEAGVAIYQVEPIPGGSGELGEVSVRFRDTAGDRMVERGWSIPYDSGAPAIDRSTPSMQLAVLAMFAAEKLRGGPLADAIDFRQLAALRAGAKRYYEGSSRVAEVLHMIDSL